MDGEPAKRGPGRPRTKHLTGVLEDRRLSKRKDLAPQHERFPGKLTANQLALLASRLFKHQAFAEDLWKRGHGEGYYRLAEDCYAAGSIIRAAARKRAYGEHETNVRRDAKARAAKAKAPASGQ